MEQNPILGAEPDPWNRFIQNLILGAEPDPWNRFIQNLILGAEPNHFTICLYLVS